MKPKKHNLAKHIGVRVKPELHTAFLKKAEPVNRPSAVLRELILAFVENRDPRVTPLP